MKRARESEWDSFAYLTIRRRRDAILRPLSRALSRLRVPASAVSLLGVLLAATSCWSVPHSPAVALLAFVGALTCDAIDGALARHLRVDSAVGKVIDHACDTATFLFVLLAISRCPFGSIAQVVVAALLAVPLLLLAIHARRRRPVPTPEPSGGFLAHAFKAPIYGAFLLYTAGGANLLEPALRLANLMAFGSLLLLGGHIALSVPRRDGPPAPATSRGDS